VPEKLLLLRKVRRPLVSVIIPTLNEEKYIEKTLITVKNQLTSFPYEIIVSDGKSKDNTVEKAKKYADKIIICDRRGISVGRNTGAKYASGKYLVFLDADTLLLPDTLEKLINELRKKDVVLVSCFLFPSEYDAACIFYYWVFNQFSRGSVRLKPQIPGIIMACKKDAFEAIGGFNEKMKILEDFDFSERISKLGKVKIVSSTFVLTSPRRFKKWGRAKGAARYLAFYLGYLLTGKDTGARLYRPVR